MSTTHPTTPPPFSYPLMTPPSTGTLSKRVQFVNTPKTSSNPKPTSKRSSTAQEGESPFTFSKDTQEISDIKLSETSQIDTASSTDMAPLAFPPSPKPSITAKDSILNRHNSFASPELAITTPSTFPFLKLPLSIRQAIYSHLLTIPALICVRQKHTPFHPEAKAFLSTEPRSLLPGIAYALAQLTVDGPKTRFPRFHTTNLALLRINKETHAESKAILYGQNEFEILKPTTDMAPPPDYAVTLFPNGCQKLVKKLNMRIRSFYDLAWLLGEGARQIRRFYCGLDRLTLILEVESAGKGFGREWAWKDHEERADYIERLRGELVKHVFAGAAAAAAKQVHVVPRWINLRVLFSGERYVKDVRVLPHIQNCNTIASDEQLKRTELGQALVEAWELLKKIGAH